MATSFATQTRQAAGQASSALAPPNLELVRRTRRSKNERSGERDRLLERVVAEYRDGPREVWAAVLLDLLTPAILDRLSRYREELPGVDGEDIRQQFVVELLSVAATMPMPSAVPFVERRLVLRAGQGVRRWLRKEACYRARSESFEARFSGEDQ